MTVVIELLGMVEITLVSDLVKMSMWWNVLKKGMSLQSLRN